MGLGDALYVQSIARHLVSRGTALEVRTAWPDLFRGLAPKATVAPFTRDGIHILAHYPTRKKIQVTTQFQDCCITAGISGDVELKLDWVPTNRALIDSLQTGLPIVCVQLPRSPMGRTDGFGAELLPNCSVIQKMIDKLKGRALVVQIGAGKPLYAFRGIDIDLANKTSVTDLIDVSTVAAGFLGYPSFLIPLAESLAKPVMAVWSRLGLKSGQPYIQQITPAKLLHHSTSRYIVDDANDKSISEAADAIL